MTPSSMASPQILPLHLALEKAMPLPAQHVGNVPTCFPYEFLELPWGHQLQKALSCWFFKCLHTAQPHHLWQHQVFWCWQQTPALQGSRAAPSQSINSRGSKAPSCWRAPALQPEGQQRQRDDSEQFLTSRASRNARSHSAWSCRSRAADTLMGICSVPVSKQGNWDSTLDLIF